MDDPVADLIAKCAAADRAAFRALYRASSAKLMGVLLRILGDARAGGKLYLNGAVVDIQRWLKFLRHGHCQADCRQEG